MTTITRTLDDWMLLVDAAATATDLARLLDDFRVLPWTDYERSKMAQCYMEKLGTYKVIEDETTTKPETPVVDDGPVWYEKM